MASRHRTGCGSKSQLKSHSLRNSLPAPAAMSDSGGTALLRNEGEGTIKNSSSLQLHRLIETSPRARKIEMLLRVFQKPGAIQGQYSAELLSAKKAYALSDFQHPVRNKGLEKLIETGHLWQELRVRGTRDRKKKASRTK